MLAAQGQKDAKARDVLGWSSRLTIEDGIESALAWTRRRKEILGIE